MEKLLNNYTIEELKKKLELEPKPYKLFAVVAGIPVFTDTEKRLYPGEEFKEHPEVPVEVSNYGRIRYKGDILLQIPDKKKPDPYGYLWIKIPDIRRKWHLVYRLVAETEWCVNPNRKLYKVVHHISNNGTDNQPSNLLWVTKEQHYKIHH